MSDSDYPEMPEDIISRTHPRLTGREREAVILARKHYLKVTSDLRAPNDTTPEPGDKKP